nr:MAG TPA: hypothetical protein [Crassvirales sp.]
MQLEILEFWRLTYQDVLEVKDHQLEVINGNIKMKLLKFEGYKVIISPEALALTPFKKIWNRDRSANKNRAIAEISYIYFMADPRSDYQYIIDEESRKASIKEGEGLPNDWEPDNLVLEAMEFYKTFKPASALLLEDTRVAVDKLRTLLREIDLGALDDKGKPIYTLNTITATIKQIPTLVKDLNEAEAAIAKEIAQSNKVRGAQEKAMYEDL